MTVSPLPIPSSLINGIPGDCVDLLDRGLQYGDGLFETIPVVDGEAKYWSAHINRLQRGCSRLKLDFPGEAALERDAEKLTNNSVDGVLKIIVTRGAGQRGYRCIDTEGTRIVSFFPQNQSVSTRPGLSKLRFCEQRLGINPSLAGLKHLNRLEQVLARSEWEETYDEGIMQDCEGRVIEGTMSNLFLVRDGVLITPELTRCGVAGIMREQILKEAEKLNIPSTIRDVNPAELKQADELFVCNSLIGIWPVGSLQDKQWISGPVTLTLMNSLGLPC